MTGKQLREAYLKFFESKSHLRLPSASLIPENDPTLLMIGAGMAPFKAFFTGKMKPPKTRITTCQRCVRTGDIENVGRTARHQTYFEMLGNFSFGDYFKADAIPWAWEFLTEICELPKDKLWVSIYPKDDEAKEIWEKQPGFNPTHIVRMEDNFWEIGPGPCGPDSEIYIDLGEERGCGKSTCGVGCDCDRFLEIWNLVFTQFDRTEAGEYNPLAHKNIDTGCGLERLASVLQEVNSNFETDLLFPIIEYASKISSVKYGDDPKKDVSLKVIADHARSMTVMIMDGILPSNEGRGYVLRRILRRAIRHGRMLGIQQKFLDGAVEAVCQIYKDVPDFEALFERKDYIKKVISLEEERFATTLSQGTEILNQHIDELKKAGKNILPGEVGFRLYDTFGFPWELTDEILHENNLQLDKDEFDKAMNSQRDRARKARSANARVNVPDLRDRNIGEVTYNPDAKSAKVLAIWIDGQLVNEIDDGKDAGIIIDQTPFYAEGGGQVGDEGIFTSELGRISVSNAKKLPDGTIYHLAHIDEGILKVGDTVKIELDIEKKLSSARNHTATHLLQAALRKVIGDQVHQAGSLVTPERLRFDFSNFEPVSKQQLADVEELVNNEILKADDVQIDHMKIDDAKKLGAMALFGEKYGDIVRVVTVPNFSVELCGGSHVKNIGQIGRFKIVSETGIAAGVRRIEAITGKAALEDANHQKQILDNISAQLKTKVEDLPAQIEKLISTDKEMKQQLKEVEAVREKAEAQQLLMAAKEYESADGTKVQFVTGRVNVKSIDELRTFADNVCEMLTLGVVIVGTVIDGKIALVAKANKNAVDKKVHAGKIIQAVTKVLDGKGGGRPDMAQGGGKNIEKIPEAFDIAVQTLKDQIS